MSTLSRSSLRGSGKPWKDTRNCEQNGLFARLFRGVVDRERERGFDLLIRGRRKSRGVRKAMTLGLLLTRAES
jgi:hypothetical protein